MVKKTIYTEWIKGILDRLLGIIGLVCLFWLLLIIGVIIYLDDPGPVLFKQKRVGKKADGVVTYFNIYKFRTMRVDTPELPTHLMKNPEQWITRTGAFLRKTSLDELPQLWNIAVEHNLSLVGPRPALWSQQDLIEERERYGANDVTPGLTGWAQVNGRDELSIQEKARLDGEYVRKISFLFDLKCLLATVAAVLKSDGVVEGGTGTLSRKRKEGTGESEAECRKQQEQ